MRRTLTIPMSRDQCDPPRWTMARTRRVRAEGNIEEQGNLGKGEGKAPLRHLAPRTPVTKYSVSPKQLKGTKRCCSYISDTRSPSTRCTCWATASSRIEK